MARLKTMREQPINGQVIHLFHMMILKLLEEKETIQREECSNLQKRRELLQG